MTGPESFPHLKAAAQELAGSGEPLSRENLRRLLCHDCAFWHEEHEDELECSCFMMLRIMLSRGAITPQSLAEALRREPEE